MITFMLALEEWISGRDFTVEGEQRLTLSPLATAIRNLALDDLEDVELEGRVADLQDSLQDSLRRTATV